MAESAGLPLAGITVLITRPAEQAAGLCALIEAAGGRALRLPLLEIVPVEDNRAAAELLDRPDYWDWLIFVSANAVRFALATGGRAVRPSPRTCIAAVGEATAGALAQAGVRVDLIPKPKFNSESLLADPDLADVAGKRILIVRGVGGREHLAEVLRERGAETAYAELYRRANPRAANAAACIDLWRRGGIDAVVVTSGDALSRLMELLGETGAELACRTPLAVIGARIAELARESGWRRVAVAGQANDQGIADAIIQLHRDVVIRSGDPARRNIPDKTYRPFIDGDTALVDEEKVLMSATEQSAAPAEPEAGDKPAAPLKPRKSRSAAWIGYVVLLAVVALSVGGWFLLQELRSKQEGLGGQLSSKDQQLLEVTRQLNAVQSEMAALHSQVATIQSQATTEESKFERMLSEHTAQLNDRLDATRAELGGAVQHIQRQLNKTRGDLMVADAEYLLSIANQKLHLVGDVKAVIAAMEAADQRLHDSGDPAVFKVREALAAEIDTLKKLDAPDVVGISAKLLMLESKVKDVPLFLPHADAASKRAEKPEAGETSGEEQAKDVLDSALKDLKDLVTVRRTDRPIEAVLTPEEAEALRQILLLKLETTRAALLRGDETLYKSSLTSAVDWLKEHFDTSAPETRELESELNGLLAHSISIPFPDISKSLSLLRNIEKLRLEAEEAEARPAKDNEAQPAEQAAPPPEARPEPGAQP
jgi:uroporphyrinogen-III synthase/uncharacterized protein HemX